MLHATADNLHELISRAGIVFVIFDMPTQTFRDHTRLRRAYRQAAQQHKDSMTTVFADMQLHAKLGNGIPFLPTFRLYRDGSLFAELLRTNNKKFTRWFTSQVTKLGVGSDVLRL